MVPTLWFTAPTGRGVYEASRRGSSANRVPGPPGCQAGDDDRVGIDHLIRKPINPFALAEQVTAWWRARDGHDAEA